MENRRPPHAKPPGRYAERSRGTSTYRGAGVGSGDGQSRDRGRSEKTWNSRNAPRRSPGATDDRRREGRGRRPDGNRFNDQNRQGFKQGRPGSRGQQARKDRFEPPVRLTSDAQVSDGKFRGHELKNSNSPLSLPTKRKVREVVFKILARRVKAGRILDLGAASGTFGIEAISRGAMLATFVERSARMCSYIRKNLGDLGIKDGHGEIVEMEILPYLRRNARKGRSWDIVYLDLPESDSRSSIIDFLSRGHTIKPTGLLIIQHASSNTFPEKLSQLSRWRIVDQGETILSIYERI